MSDASYDRGMIGPTPIGSLVLADHQGGLEYLPLKDITPWEVARVQILLTIYAAKGLEGRRWREYIREHGLQRHFREA